MSSNSPFKARLSEQTAFESSEDAFTYNDRAAENAVLRKVDWHILPIITFIYMLSVIDR